MLWKCAERKSAPWIPRLRLRPLPKSRCRTPWLALAVVLALRASVLLYAQFGADRPWEGPAASHGVIATRAGRLFDGKSDKLSNAQVILVEGSRITDVGPAERLKPPAGAEIIDLSRTTVLPGLIDAHTHLFLTGESHGRYGEQLLKGSWQYRTIEAVVNAKKDLEAGFTTLRDLETEGAMYSDVDVPTPLIGASSPARGYRWSRALPRPRAGILWKVTRPKCRCRLAPRSWIHQRLRAKPYASRSSTVPTSLESTRRIAFVSHPTASWPPSPPSRWKRSRPVSTKRIAKA